MDTIVININRFLVETTHVTFNAAGSSVLYQSLTLYSMQLVTGHFAEFLEKKTQIILQNFLNQNIVNCNQISKSIV